MTKTTEHARELTLPLITVRGTVAFPGVQLNLELAREATLRAFSAANEADGTVFLLTQKDPTVEEPSQKDLYHIGTVCQIKRINRSENGTIHAVFEGLCRAKLSSLTVDTACTYATVICKTVHVEETVSGDAQEKMDTVLGMVRDVKSIHPILNDDIFNAAAAIKTPGLFCDFIASSVLLNFKSKQRILEVFHPLTRLERLLYVVTEELEFLRMEYDIHCQVKQRIDDHQKEYFLREQIKAIQQELGDEDDEIAEYQMKIDKASLPDNVREKLLKELGRLAKTPFGAAEGSVLRTYLDTCLEFPWCKTTETTPDVAFAKRILDEDHEGLSKVKTRILEYVAVKQLSPDVKNQIICLVGPPGVGKTSIAASIARAMKRKYARISLGGIRDEADIRGHRKTYVGAMPGRIITALCECKSANPLMVLDEIDKMTSDSRGDPASAMLEVLDSEQNKHFRDHFVEMSVDLSRCMFIATANSLDNIPKPLIDRMEIIELSSYTKVEKLNIAKKHLVPKQLKLHGLNRRMLKISDGAINRIIESYTAEAGVRSLEREIASLSRKAAKEIIEKGVKSVSITENNISKYLGTFKYEVEKIDESNQIGVVNGMAYTSIGGDLLKIEASVMKGTGKLQLTGKLGEVMRESCEIAVSFIRENAVRLGIDPDFYTKNDIHIHAPEGAVPKDGPSAGVTVATALVSILTGRAVRRDIAMTGEITLRGKVLPIGGLKEKTLAAYSAGVTTIVIPKKNEKDLCDIDKTVLENVKFIPCDNIFEVLSVAFSDEEIIAIFRQYAGVSNK